MGILLCVGIAYNVLVNGKADGLTIKSSLKIKAKPETGERIFVCSQAPSNLLT